VAVLAVAVQFSVSAIIQLNEAGNLSENAVTGCDSVADEVFLLETYIVVTTHLF